MTTFPSQEPSSPIPTLTSPKPLSPTLTSPDLSSPTLTSPDLLTSSDLSHLRKVSTLPKNDTHFKEKVILHFYFFTF